MTLQGAKLHMSADVDDDGFAETGTFDFTSGDGLEIELFTRTGNVVSQAGATPLSIYNALLESEDNEREAISIDLGGGAFGCRIQFQNWHNSALTWGDGGGSATDATGSSDPIELMSVFNRYLAVGEYDSKGNAQLEVGKWYDGGDYDTWNAVMFEEPSMQFSVEEPTITRGSITVFKARDIAQLGAAEEQRG